MKMKNNYLVGLFAFCGAMTFMNPANVWANTEIISGPGLSSGGYVVTVDANTVNINKEHDDNEVLTQASQGSTYGVLEDMGDGWVKVQVGTGYGFIPLDGNARIIAEDAQDEIEAEGKGSQEVANTEETTTSRRDTLVNYALQFVGGPYRYGGRDPRTGFDCSGFTGYVMQHGAGVMLNRSSGTQASQGVTISADQMRPGDLIFYSNGRRINHVALYIGNGQVVHASTYETGVKISNWNYRTPYKIINVLGD